VLNTNKYRIAAEIPFSVQKTHIMRSFIVLCCLLAVIPGLLACKKCITCIAKDTTTNEIKFNETSCSKGPLLDDWVKLIKESYPEPAYNTQCK
jgi:hypothetical protein